MSCFIEHTLQLKAISMSVIGPENLIFCFLSFARTQLFLAFRLSWTDRHRFVNITIIN
jgi:hypothetical protein